MFVHAEKQYPFPVIKKDDFSVYIRMDIPVQHRTQLKKLSHKKYKVNL